MPVEDSESPLSGSARTFPRLAMQHFGSLVSEFGFSPSQPEYHSWSTMPEKVLFTRDARKAAVYFDIRGNGVAIELDGADDTFRSDTAPLVAQCCQGRVGEFGVVVDDDEFINLKLKMWADTLYPIWPRFLDGRSRMRVPSNVVQLSGCAGNLNTAIVMPPLSHSRIFDRTIAPTVRFVANALSVFEFMETCYGFRYTAEGLGRAGAQERVRYVKQLSPGQIGVVAVEISYALMAIPWYGIDVTFIWTYGDQRRSLEECQHYDMRILLDWNGKTLQPEVSFPLTEEDVRKELRYLAGVVRANFDAVLRGDLTLFRERHERMRRAPREAALNWSRKEVARAWGLKDWYEVARLYRWMGSDRTPEETARLNEAMRLLGPNPINPWLARAAPGEA